MKIFLFTFFYSLTVLADVTPDEILKKVDEVRNPSGSYEMTVDIESSDSSDISTFEVSLKGNDKTLIKTTRPIKDRGRNMLMLEENMWVFIPNIKRSVRVSLAQKLTGLAANGDIARMRWSDDYSAKIEKQDKNEYVLFLSANKKGLTYDQLRVWVNSKNYYPIRVEYLSLNQKILKTARYEDFKQLAGRVRPSKIEIQDSINNNLKSTIFIRHMAEKEFNDSIFNQKNLN